MQNITLLSPLQQSLRLKPSKNKRIKKSGVATMMLTSLVDAFTIVVIYLIINSSANEQMDIKEGIQLPQASHSLALDQSPLIIYKNKQFLVDDKVIAENQLKNALETLKNKFSHVFKNSNTAVIVQADESVDFQELQPVVIAASYAGIKQVKFAVMQKD